VRANLDDVAEGGKTAKYLAGVGFIPLPDSIRALSEKQIALIKP
jgi:hypothetical protein